jgi:hypothetical protein
MAYVKSLKGMVTRLIDRNLDSQLAWEDFIQKLPDSEYPEEKENYLRMNLEFLEDVPKPKLHRVEELEELRCETEAFCRRSEKLMRSIAHKLLASLFYVRLDGAPSEDDGVHCKGEWMTHPICHV